MKNLEIDIETFSSVNLAKSGVYRYVEVSGFRDSAVRIQRGRRRGESDRPGFRGDTAEGDTRSPGR